MKRLIWMLLMTGLAGGSLRSENWPVWRGPTRQGISSESGLPTRWDAQTHVKWRTEIPGQGWSSPIVYADRVFLTTATREGRACHVLCVDRQTGAILWDRHVFDQDLKRKESRNSYATPTPAADAERVFAVFGDGSFVALSHAGDEVWTNRSHSFYGQHGLGTSPIIYQDLLIMARDGSSEGNNPKLGWQIPWDQGHVLALDCESGQLRWKGERGASRIAHVVPNIWIGPSGRALVISGAGDVVQAFYAANGERAWTASNIGEGVVPSIVIGGDLAFTASGWGGRQSIKAFRLSESEVSPESDRLVWEQRRNMPRIPSYLFREPYLFTVAETGIAMCLEAATGEIVWRERLDGEFSASPVWAEDRLYVCSDSGDTFLLAAGPEFEILSRNPLKEKIQASMAVSQGNLFIRTEENLICIGD